jgi:hypothetical protein
MVTIRIRVSGECDVICFPRFKSVHDGHLKIDHDGVEFCAPVFCNRFLALGGFIALSCDPEIPEANAGFAASARCHPYENASAQRSDCSGLWHTSLMPFRRDTFIPNQSFAGT